MHLLVPSLTSHWVKQRRKKERAAPATAEGGDQLHNCVSMQISHCIALLHCTMQQQPVHACVVAFPLAVGSSLAIFLYTIFHEQCNVCKGFPIEFYVHFQQRYHSIQPSFQSASCRCIAGGVQCRLIVRFPALILAMWQRESHLIRKRGQCNHTPFMLLLSNFWLAVLVRQRYA